MLEKDGFSMMPKLKYDDDDVLIKIRLTPKAPHMREKKGRGIASYGAYIKIGGEEEMIKSAIQTKATRYGELDKPFLICLNYPSDLLHKEDIDIALYGNDGAFGAENNPRNTRVSAVLITTFTVSGLLNTNLYYHENPFAKKKIDFLLFTDLIKGLNLTDRNIQEFG